MKYGTSLPVNAGQLKALKIIEEVIAKREITLNQETITNMNYQWHTLSETGMHADTTDLLHVHGQAITRIMRGNIVTLKYDPESLVPTWISFIKLVKNTNTIISLPSKIYEKLHKHPILVDCVVSSKTMHIGQDGKEIHSVMLDHPNVIRDESSYISSIPKGVIINGLEKISKKNFSELDTQEIRSIIFAELLKELRKSCKKNKSIGMIIASGMGESAVTLYDVLSEVEKIDIPCFVIYETREWSKDAFSISISNPHK